VLNVRVVFAIVAALMVSCSAPVTDTTTGSASTGPTRSDASVNPSPTQSAAASPSAATSPRSSGPVSAGAVSDAGLLFFFDYGDAPDLGRTVTPALYRYDGGSGTLATISEGGGWYSWSVAHETAAGIYAQGPNGRWDLLHWDGTRASDQEFTACQQEAGSFASWCSVSATGVGVGFGSHTGPGPGPFTGPWCPPAFIRLPGTTRSTGFPSGLCVQWAQVSTNGTQVLIGDLAPEATPGALIGAQCAPGYVTVDGKACYRQRLWIMPVGGLPRQLHLSPDLPGFIPTLSPDGTSAVGLQQGTLFLVDLLTGATTALGPGYQGATRWRPGGGLAFVRGAADSWSDTVVVVAADGSTRDVPGAQRTGANALPVGLAPAWDPAGLRLAWIAAPAGVAAASDLAGDYLKGTGVGDRRVLVSDLSADPIEIRCGDSIAEGVRWSLDGAALLLLCRRPGARVGAFELWLYRLGAAGAAVPIVRGITWGGVDPHGFAPDLFTYTAWSRSAPGVR